MKYRAGYKYQLVERFTYETGIIPGRHIQTEEYALSVDGLLTVDKGFCWDGASGGIDTKNSMRASLVHDVLYDMIRCKLLPLSTKEQADDLLYDICRIDGMSAVRAWAWKKAVNWFGNAAIKQQRETLGAP